MTDQKIVPLRHPTRSPAPVLIDGLIIRIPISKELGNFIRLARLRREWTLLQVSQRVHTNINTLSHIERAEITMEWDMAVALSRILQAPDILTYAENVVKTHLAFYGPGAA